MEGWRGTDRSLGSLGGLASAALGSTLSPEALWGTAVSAVSLEGASGSGPYSGRRRVHAAAVGTRTKCLLCARDGDTPSVSSVPPNAPRRPGRWGQGLNCWNYRSLLDVGVGGSERFIRVSAAPPLHTPAPGEPPEDRPCLSLPPTLHHPQRASPEHCLEPSTPTFLPAVPSSRRLTCHPLGPVPSSNPTSVHLLALCCPPPPTQGLPCPSPDVGGGQSVCALIPRCQLPAGAPGPAGASISVCRVVLPAMDVAVIFMGAILEVAPIIAPGDNSLGTLEGEDSASGTWTGLAGAWGTHSCCRRGNRPTSFPGCCRSD